MMRPWDLRAHTFLSEVVPKWLAVHGQHDHEELKIHGVPTREVEALRYQQLATPSVAGPDGIALATPSSRRWLVVGGADCDASARQLAELIDAARSNGIEREFVVKWHPQCRQPDDLVGANIEWTSRPLHEIARTVNAALMVGSAAPLDTYLAGVPSCSLSEPSGLSMTPIEEDDFFHLAVDAVDAVRWLASADHRRNAQPPISRYFLLDNRLSRWRTFISDTMSASK
jgi:surface carbohydrate biosynthesis protein (TIGR04326 family)